MNTSHQILCVCVCVCARVCVCALTFWARAENLRTLSVSSKQDEFWLMFTTMETRPAPQKKNCRKWVSLDSLKGMWCWNLQRHGSSVILESFQTSELWLKLTEASYLAFCLSFMALMHFPSVSRELLMFPASFSLSPVFWVREQRSDPARSHRASLNKEMIIYIPHWRCLRLEHAEV